jgi:hypothetical protein
MIADRPFSMISHGAPLRPIAYKLRLFGSPQLVTATGDVIPISKRALGILLCTAVTNQATGSSVMCR